MRIEKITKEEYYILELPDNTHIRIPSHWADQDNVPLAKITSTGHIFTIQSIRELISIITNIEKKLY